MLKGGKRGLLSGMRNESLGGASTILPTISRASASRTEHALLRDATESVNNCESLSKFLSMKGEWATSAEQPARRCDRGFGAEEDSKHLYVN
jgi:hypothetical protein